MRINQIISERVVNAFNSDKMYKYADQVWDILQLSYKNVEGGFGTADSVEELIDKSALWKMVIRDGRVTAVGIYRDQYGRKSIAAGTDGTPAGKRDYFMIKNSDVNLGRAWGEVSGAPERLMAKSGAKPLPNEYAAMLTGKEIIDLNPDGFHYTRMIAGEPHEKIIYGVVHLTTELRNKLVDAGIDLRALPSNFKKT